MPTVTAADIDRDRRESAARVEIEHAIRDARRTLTQAAHLLATMLRDMTKRIEAYDEDGHTDWT